MQYHWLLTHHWLGLITLWRILRLLWILGLSILRLPVLRLRLAICRLPILWLLLLRIIRLPILCLIRRRLWWVLPCRHRARLCYRGSCAGRGSKRAAAI